MAFWGADHTEKATINDPKRKFRFLVQIDGMVECCLVRKDYQQAWFFH
jgi:hypothetical protein